MGFAVALALVFLVVIPEGNLLSECRSKILPRRVHSLYQRNLLRPDPVFQLLFSCNGIANVAEILEVNETMDIVVRRMSAWNILAMSVDPSGKAVAHADVEVSRPAGEDVDPVTCPRKSLPFESGVLS